MYCLQMLPRTAVRAARPLFQASRHSTAIVRQPLIASQIRRATTQAEAEVDPNVEDPGMNGGYPILPAVKRQHRDPYGDWWDKQERRNFGEPVHEDNDILGVFSTEDYTWVKASWGLVLFGTFVATFAGLCAVVYQYYPDTPTTPRRFPGGLDKELGGSGAVIAPSDSESD
ncbi:hypothetical protein NA57DRAFT_54649 [Rhizodiscina lignyota]|uniref:NADH dehydrogenase (Ubiquinone) 1 beta subcomplex 8 n=1 Tax=Rhizodiscina lignyota TaxID=1504668 RepID=A0A9P4M812_9PEZI|nr:hypothetical protein NA57DRAFT_54649 [Rhizodiscina lignyota]